MYPRVLSFATLVAFILATAMAIPYDLSRGQDSLVESVLKAMNRSVDPCQNFYQYACGGWLSDAVIPDEESNYSRSFTNIGKHNAEILSNIMKNTNDTKVATFYSSCMNTTAIEERGVNAVVKLLQDIDDSIDASNYVITSIETAAQLHKLDVKALFDIFSGTHPGNPEINVAQLNQGGLKLPKSIYEDENGKLFRLYKEHASRMFSLAGLSSETGLEAVMVERKLSQIFQSDEELDDPFVTYNIMTFQQLVDKYPNIHFYEYANALSYPFKVANVNSVKYFERLNSLIKTLSRSELTSYLQWSALNSVATYLPKALRDENFNFFNTILRGEEAPPTRERQCVDSADESIGFLIGKYFVEKSFSQKAKDKNIEMIKNVESAFRNNFRKISWMDDETRNAALKKLDEIVDRVGYPDVWPTYEQDLSNDYFANKVALRQLSVRKTLSSFDKPVDRTIWEMTPSTVNAYYEPTSNSINFPAGILYNPYFSLEFPEEMNYGGVGLIMGHEISHGFDNHGRLYDGKGKLNDWWTEEAGKKFQQRAQCLVDQYDGFCPLEGHCVNGKLTLGENIADNAGLKEAYLAYSNLPIPGSEPSIIPNLSHNQLFFVAFAQGWCTKTREAEIIRRLEVDVHSPPMFRVLGTIMNSPYFANAFNCPANSPMNPTNKCEIF